MRLGTLGLFTTGLLLKRTDGWMGREGQGKREKVTVVNDDAGRAPPALDLGEDAGDAGGVAEVGLDVYLFAVGAHAGGLAARYGGDEEAGGGEVGGEGVADVGAGAEDEEDGL